MNETSIEKIISTLERQKELGQSTIVFLGAGASASSGIPLASGIVDYINQHYSDTKDQSDKSYFQTLASIHPAERKRVFKHFTEDAKVNETHLITAVLIYLGYVDVVLTTNFDPLLQRTVSILRLEATKIDIANNVNIQGHHISTPTIYYLHGELSNVWQYNTLDELSKKKTNIQGLLSQLSINRSWIIVGYSGNDPIFDTINEFEKFDNGLFWIGYKYDLPEKHVQNLLGNKTKNTYFLKGYDSDSFFKRLINELNVQNSVLTAYLGSSLIQMDDQIELHKDRGIQLSESIKPIRITNACRAWIKEFGQKSQPLEVYHVEQSLKDKIKYWFDRSLTVDSEINRMKSRLIKGNYNAVLNIAESIIAQDSTNAVAYFYRGFAYGLKAKEIESPWERTPLFVNSMQDFDTARKLMNNAESQQKEYADINNIIKAFWAEEHNEAIGYLTDDSLRTSVNNPELYAISHLKNATTIQPDSALSYIVLASTQFNQGDTPLAIETYEKAMDHLDKPKQDDYEFLISLYLNQNQYDKAYKLTKQALEDYPENTQFVQFLADIYIQKGEIDKAISIIENLIENEPDNPQYYRVLGTQVYQSVSSINSKLVVLYKEAFEMKEELRSMPEEERDGMKYEIENVRNQIEELQNESDELTAISIENLEKVVNLKPDDDYAHNILGIIHQNTAANLFERRNSFPVNSEPFQEVDQDAREALQCALNYYEKAAEINPAKTEFWESLFHVYDTLGMDEEAKVLKESGKF